MALAGTLFVIAGAGAAGGSSLAAPNIVGIPLLIGAVMLLNAAARRLAPR
ncbi:hypothetical protein OHA72_41730 [Dactylosporangium sp. NBC_01737]|nr:hypothetical protein OHA72_41730 [Dactylosporangium sp. NBC_01737]